MIPLFHIETPERPLRIFALFLRWWPVVIFATLYGAWFLAWYHLGHPPRPSLDDPRSIAGSAWTIDIVDALWLPSWLFMWGAVATNVAYMEKYQPQRIERGRSWLAVFAPWIILILHLFFDPLNVMLWYFD